MVVPSVWPLTIPGVPTVAIVVLVLIHAPPVVASLSEVVAPWHTLFVPLMAVIGLTVTTVVDLQPVADNR